MIWVTWRQFRATIVLGTLAPLTLAAIVVATTVLSGRIGANYFLFRCFGLATGTCVAESTLTLATLTTLALPVALGVFVGVTVFSRDIERRTHVLGLTQDIGRMRWYWTRVLVVFPPIVAAMALLGITISWSRFGSNPYGASFVDTLYSRLEFPTFSSIGLVPAGYTALGLLVGSTSALLLRNTIGAMVATLIVTAGVIIAFPTLVREHYATPKVEQLTLEDRESGGSVAYVLDPGETLWRKLTFDSSYVDSEGDRVDLGYDTCVNDGRNWPEPAPMETTSEYNDRVDAHVDRIAAIRAECLRAEGIDHFENLYFEDRMLWRFQFTETAICLLLAAALSVGATFAVRRLRP